MTSEDRDELFAEFMALRGVKTPCDRCSGFGVTTYANTATWRGGIGGSAMTQGICNKCWGSGDSDRPWLDLRTVQKVRGA